MVASTSVAICVAVHDAVRECRTTVPVESPGDVHARISSEEGIRLESHINIVHRHPTKATQSQERLDFPNSK